MAQPKLEKIQVYASEFEAQAACNFLEEKGIVAFIDGANGQTALSYIGPALAGVKLLVADSNAERAMQALATRDQNDENLGPWTCRTCFSEVDEGFEVCWKCGSLRAESEWIPDESDSSDEIGDISFSANANEVVAEPRVETGSPYQIPVVDAALAGEPGKNDFLASEQVERAWRAAILGVILLPGITHLYSLYLLSRAAMLPSDSYDERTRRRFYFAFAVDVCTLGVLASLYWRVFVF